MEIELALLLQLAEAIVELAERQAGTGVRRLAVQLRQGAIFIRVRRRPLR